MQARGGFEASRAEPRHAHHVCGGGRGRGHDRLKRTFKAPAPHCAAASFANTRACAGARQRPVLDLCSLRRIGQGSSHRKATGQNGSAIVYLRTVPDGTSARTGAWRWCVCSGHDRLPPERGGHDRLGRPESRESASGKKESSIKHAVTDL